MEVVAIMFESGLEGGVVKLKTSINISSILVGLGGSCLFFK